MQIKESSTGDQLKADISQFFGFLPPTFAPSHEVLPVLQILLQQTLRGIQLETVFEAMTDGVVVYGDDGKMLHVNNAYRKMINLDVYREHALLMPDMRGDMLALRDEHGQLLDNSRHWTWSWIVHLSDNHRTGPGQLGVESTPGVRFTFWFSLPLTQKTMNEASH